ncbi:MAG: methyltransferase domain-containing protein [Chloroflexi bacterium]|nr:methyltransferase domain-containing protein [Chloroflexota bacterium]
MCCPHCENADDIFDPGTASADLDDYRRSGPAPMTARLLDILKAAGVTGLSLLDIGGGVGVIQHELVAAGVTNVTGVDASRAYLSAARNEATRRGYADHATYLFGDFVSLADQVADVDIVTLDRVICCYPDVTALVNAAASKARRYLGVIYPRDILLAKIAIPFLNLWWRLRGRTFRNFVHPSATVDTIAESYGLRKIAQHDGVMWQLSVFSRG